MFWPACHRCNSVAENVQSKEFRELLNLERILPVIEKYDPERYQKYLNSL